MTPAPNFAAFPCWPELIDATRGTDQQTAALEWIAADARAKGDHEFARACEYAAETGTDADFVEIDFLIANANRDPGDSFDLANREADYRYELSREWAA